MKGHGTTRMHTHQSRVPLASRRCLGAFSRRHAERCRARERARALGRKRACLSLCVSMWSSVARPFLEESSSSLPAQTLFQLFFSWCYLSSKDPCTTRLLCCITQIKRRCAHSVFRSQHSCCPAIFPNCSFQRLREVLNFLHPIKLKSIVSQYWPWLQ